jgi:hypothetical protein
MICVRCRNEFEAEGYRPAKQCPYCQVVNDPRPGQDGGGIYEKAHEAVAEYKQEAVDMAAGGWVE